MFPSESVPRGKRPQSQAAATIYTCPDEILSPFGWAIDRLSIFPLGSMADPEISRFPCKELACMPDSPTTPGHPSACANALEYIAFRYTDSVGARDWFSIAAQWLACTYPDRRFAGALSDACARLGANADRYSFIAVDSHGRFRVKWSGSSAPQKTPVAVSVSKV